MADDLPESAPGNRADEHAIRELLDRQIEGWNSGEKLMDKQISRQSHR